MRKRIRVYWTGAIVFCMIIFCYVLHNRHQNLTSINGAAAVVNQLSFNEITKDHNYMEKAKTFKNIRDQSSFTVLDYTARYHKFKDSAIIDCGEIGRVRWTDDRSQLKYAHVISFHLHQMQADSMPIIRPDQLSLIYVMESERNSPQSRNWEKMDFALWYNLDRSFPFPITYFDPYTYVRALLESSVPRGSEKTVKSKGIIWMISNCNAPNGRIKIVEELKKYIHIDCPGSCLNNAPIYSRSVHKTTIYRPYKFVIAIENSNCEDYISEKFIDAIQSGSVPIVAGHNGKPDYERFAPQRSFVNIYDFDSLKDLAIYLQQSLDNDILYEKRHFTPSYFSALKEPASQQQSQVLSLPQSQLLSLARDTIFKDEPFTRHLLKKETGKNKYCKLLEFFKSNQSDDMTIKMGKRKRPTHMEVCLDDGFWIRRFNL